MRRPSPGELARAIESERFGRYGISQAQMRIAASVVLDVRDRYGARPAAVLEGLAQYGNGNWHVDREPFRAEVSAC